MGSDTFDEDFHDDFLSLEVSTQDMERIPGINLYLANAAYEVLIENGVFPLGAISSPEEDGGVS
jgi:hypothetical protein